ncbi:hypothetical protein ACFO3U_13425 [Flavobacterium ponti]|uniref:HNH endonuclease n=1 Tax=Flavobacterium ponti TaxID=665133 RepID=A0ABV9P6I3_9FLAO
MSNKTEFHKKCFFCSKEIEEKKTLEHIIPNSLLAKLKIKEQIISGNFTTQYSRVKVPAHSVCNNNFGSEYENKILSIIEDKESLYELINKNNQLEILYSPSNDNISIITTWLTKIYYGLFYNDLLKTNNLEHKDLCKEIISSQNFKLTQKSYQNGYGFNLPSSLYAFKSNKNDFNLKTLIFPSSIMLNLEGLILILCIGDGYLTKNYLNTLNIDNLRKYLFENDKLNSFPTDLFAFSEITAIRLNIPKQPSFMFTDNEMINLSLNTFVDKPEEYYKIDIDNVEFQRNEILKSFGVKLE